MLSYLAIFVFLGVTTTFSTVEGQFQLPFFPGEQFNASNYVDIVLNTVSQQIRNMSMDPLKTFDFRFKVGNNSVAFTNGTIKGLSNIQRVGDVYANVTFLDTKIRSAFSVYNLSKDQDVAIQTKNVSYPNGHIHTDCDNITVYQVYKLDHLTGTVTLDQFELSIGEFNYNVTGLGDQAQNGSATITEIISQNKKPILIFFNFTFKILVNVALQLARAALLAG